MTGLLGPNGLPISSSIYNKKAAPPKLGTSFGDWAGRENKELLKLPGGGLMQFDLDNLTLQDFRGMKDHYQVNASLATLTFMMHQLDWKIECDEQKIADHVEENIGNIWNRLVRAKSQAFWSGYSPNALEWENDVNGRTVQLTKIKDLMPEECQVNWKFEKGWAPPDKLGSAPLFRVFDGIRQIGQPYPIPTSNAYWYPLLMENGDYYGKKLLRSAFTPFFFSMLMHLFSNRYFERFGEPLPIGRAPSDETVEVNGEHVSGMNFMENVIGQIRNRSVVVLPNDQTIGSETKPEFDYQLEYLESQMRGADFERYMTRLDEEISLALFTPLLLMRTGDVGSYSLGEVHTRTWQLTLNALAKDWAEYMNRYIVSPMVNYNFSEKAPRAKIVFRDLGKTDAETVRSLVTALVAKDKAKPDLNELGQIAGLSLKEVRAVTSGTDDDGDDADAPSEQGSGDDNGNDPDEPGTGSGRSNARVQGWRYPQAQAVGEDIVSRVEGQVARAFREGTFGPGFAASLGYKKRLAEALKLDGVTANLDAFYTMVEGWVEATASLGPEEYPTVDSFVNQFKAALRIEIDRL